MVVSGIVKRQNLLHLFINQFCNLVCHMPSGRSAMMYTQSSLHGPVNIKCELTPSQTPDPDTYTWAHRSEHMHVPHMCTQPHGGQSSEPEKEFGADILPFHRQPQPGPLRDTLTPSWPLAVPALAGSSTFTNTEPCRP